MTHLTDVNLLAYLDGELSEAERSEVDRHLETCASCASELRQLEEDAEVLSAAVQSLDRPTPSVDVAALRRRGETAAAALDPAVTPIRTPSTPKRGLLAAALIFIVVAGAGAAIPGSPVRDWLGRSMDRLGQLFAGEEAIPAQPLGDAGITLEESASGVAVRPYRGQVRILVTNPAPETMIRVRMLDESRASVSAPGARYSTSPGVIEIVQAGPGDVNIQLPVSSSLARVEVNGKLVLIKDGPDFEVLVPSIDSSDAEVSFRAGGQ